MQAIVPDLQAQLTALAEALRKSEGRAAAGQFALELIHEIRNPLEALGNLTYLAHSGIDDPENMQSYLRMVEEQLTTLNQLVDQTLGFARFSLHPKTINLVAVVEAALRIHQRALESKKIHLVKDFPNDLTARVHAAEILQVLSNLIMNALDALPINGTLSLRLRRRQKEIHFVIADNGHGIQPEHRKTIFTPFFTTKDEQGTGLGLSISMRIIERHRGTIRMRSSVRVDRCGTTFRISLPG